MSTLEFDAPQLGLPAEDVRKPEAEDERYRSVTTILNVIDKPGLIYWSASETAAAAVRTQATWQAMMRDQGEAEAIDWLSKARFRAGTGKLSAAARGSVVHAVCEEYALTGARPDEARVEQLVQSEGPKLSGEQVKTEAWEVNGFVDTFDVWLQRFQPSYQAAEVTVYSPRYEYAGTADAFMTIDGVRFLADYKTAKSYDNQGKPTKPYAEQVGLQLAAYRYAEMAAVWRPRRYEERKSRWYLLSPAEREAAVPVPEVDFGLVIHITQERTEAWPIDCGEAAHRAFLFTMECAHWVNDLSKEVMRPPLVKVAP